MAGPLEQGPQGSRLPQSLYANLALKTPADFSKPGPLSPEVTHRPVPSHTHRRSSSIGSVVHDGVGNLNRWSQSTASSKGSINHGRSGSFSRRLSLGATGSIDFGNKLESTFAPHGRKESISDASATNVSPRRTTSRQARRAPNSSTTLPPIITLPSLNRLDPGHGSANNAHSPSPSTAGILSAAVRTAAPDYFGNKWEQTRPPNARSPAIGRSSSRNGDLNRSHIPASSALFADQTIRSAGVNNHRQERERSHSRGHSRNRSHAEKGSAGATGSSQGRRERGTRGPSQKAMLSKALQKANTAVVLDNARNVEGAIEAYQEACNLLLQVMSRSSGEEDRRKLEAIRNTYTSRIVELEQTYPFDDEDEKALPARPESGDYYGDDVSSLNADADEDEAAVIGVAVVTKIVDHDSYVPEIREDQNHHIQPSQVPRRRESLIPSPFETNNNHGLHLGEQFAQRSMSRSPFQQSSAHLSPPMDRQSMMVPPLSPRRPQSPASADPFANGETRATAPAPAQPQNNNMDNDHRRDVSQESMSWLDTIDESGGSTTSSVHSRTSSQHVRRKHIRATSGATEAEFDAALDAAVEAAYDDGFEPTMEEEIHENRHDSNEYENRLADMRRKVEEARERVQETEREAAIRLARDRERERLAREDHSMDQTDNYADDSEAEEERMLEEMTRGYIMDDFDFGVQSKSALPRESDSSGYSGRTWHTSMGSNQGTTMSTITEQSPGPAKAINHMPPPAPQPPPGMPLPPPPAAPAPLSRLSGFPQDTVRSRRLSGQTQLKIQTSSRSSSVSEVTASQSPAISPPGTAAGVTPTLSPTIEETLMPPPPRPAPQPPVDGHTRQESVTVPHGDIVTPPTSNAPQGLNLGDVADGIPRSGSPNRAQSRTGIRKNFSSSSLKNLKIRNQSVPNIDEDSATSAISPNTPLSTQFATARAPSITSAVPALPTPLATAFSSKLNMPSGGLYLFDNDIHDPASDIANKPIQLEPCPTEFLLRPFWLMRAIYQTLAHPRGGYLSTKLFIPRDVWKVKNVKIKGLEEKIGACDFLTAALQKLARVDTNDADAVLEEMQNFEDVLEQVRVSLTKKLGNEVGLHGTGTLFKDAAPSTEAETSSATTKSNSMPSKASAFSWKRLRSKSSGLALNTYGGKSQINLGEGAAMEGLTMSSLPLTTIPNQRFVKRDVGALKWEGPNGNYMGALARLFDAAQILGEFFLVLVHVVFV